MRLLCALGWHKPSQKIIENESRVYSRCKRCGVDLIKVGEGWKTAPRGYRVIWKDPNAPEAAAPARTAAKRKRPASKTKPAGTKGRPRKSEAAKAAGARAADTARPEGADQQDAAPGKRRRTERRVSKDKVLPAKLAGKERRRTRNRREGFGKKPDLEA